MFYIDACIDPTPLVLACHAIPDATNEFILCANYHTGSVIVYRRGAQGALGDAPTAFIEFAHVESTGVDAERQVWLIYISLHASPNTNFNPCQ